MYAALDRPQSSENNTFYKMNEAVTKDALRGNWAEECVDWIWTATHLLSEYAWFIPWPNDYVIGYLGVYLGEKYLHFAGNSTAS
jgi:hypothetical protein